MAAKHDRELFRCEKCDYKVLHNNPLNRTRQQSMMENEFGVKNVITKVLQNDPLNPELIFGATSATGGRVNFSVSCVNFLKNNAKCYKI